ncbi:hypothetical protein LTR10_001342 [Elasticomyces elasticus]|nr:hypothetical protein LTR10_001342 [Elasticomyces elasticus]KAK4965294.1 hypothetical protein LTR42_012048 [Elasticomyces elasticus]
MEYHTSSDTLDSWDIINDFDWLENAIARDLQDPAAALPYEQLSGGCARPTTYISQEAAYNLAVVSATNPAQSTNNLFHGENGQTAVHGLDSRLVDARTPVSVANVPAKSLAPHRVPETGVNIIVCVQADDAPSGRQPNKILRCGLCMSSKLFDRRYELERHMSMHFPGQYPFMQPGCTFVGPRAFKRADKLVKHKREAHGL